MVMKLAVCIPTHNGRRNQLRELLDSIALQEFDKKRIEICISDNASNDGTEEMVAQYAKRTDVAIQYFRFPTDMGVKNFIRAISLAQSEYCWLMGSDDAMTPGAIQAVLEMLDQHQAIGGCTVNKLNFDVTLSDLAGPDHEIVLPENPHLVHIFEQDEDVLSQLGMTFLFMSAHIFRRDLWNEEFRRNGIEKVSSIYYFAHSFLVAKVAMHAAGWIWIPDCLVVQRLGNSSAREELQKHELSYAFQSTNNAMSFFHEVTEPDSPSYRELLRKLYVIYWNPIQLLRYKFQQSASVSDDIKILGYCTRHFRRVMLFWFTALPFLFTPSWLVRLVRTREPEYTLLPGKAGQICPKWINHVITRILILLGIERGARREIDRLVKSTNQAANSFFASNRKLASREEIFP